MCIYCGSKRTKKNGHKKGIQIYKCYDCGKQFLGGTRVNINQLWKEYTVQKQSYKQLAEKYDVSTKTIQRRLDKVKIENQYHLPKQSIVMMDTTYFGRAFGVMVFTNPTGEVLYLKYVKYETVAAYTEGINHLVAQGLTIQGIVCDGRKGLFKALSVYPIQMCQFHQIAIITRYITRRPRLEASVELKQIINLLTKTDKESFSGLIEEWHRKWKGFIDERAANPLTGKSHYIHKRLRSAYKSIERNLPYLFTWYDNLTLKMPNTNNQLEGTFTDLKNKLRNHNGLSRVRKEKFINGFFVGIPSWNSKG